MNKNQKIALIAGAAVLAIIVITIPVMTNSNNTLNYYYPFQFKSALIWGGCCCSIYLCRIYSSEIKRLNPYTPTPFNLVR